MNCGVCGNSLFVGRAVFRCSCGVLTHAHCWEKHVLEAHQPSCVIGSITLQDEFLPNEMPNETPEDQVSEDQVSEDQVSEDTEITELSQEV